MGFRENQLKRKLRAGEVVVGFALETARDPGVVYTMAEAGADFVFIDLEHQVQSIETAADLIAHAHGAGVTPLVRIPDLQYEHVTRVLDAGCQSLLVPHLESPEEVQRLLQLAMYYPTGRRGMGYSGASTNYQEVVGPDVADMMRWQNDQLVLGLVIETIGAAECLDDMLVPEIDFALVGAADLSQRLGVPGDAQHPLVLEIVERVRTACEALGKVWGTNPRTVETIGPAIDAGARLLLHRGALSFVREAATAAVRTTRGHRAVR